MPKKVVICCDGTGNEFGGQNSNVVKLYGCLIVDGKQQIAYYHPGVGTMGAPAASNRISKAWSVVAGLAFGAGLLDNVMDAYRYLMEVFEDGDQIFLFGFSRGAFTIRAQSHFNVKRSGQHNHVLKTVASDDRSENIATYEKPDLPLAPSVVDVIANFVSASGKVR